MRLWRAFSVERMLFADELDPRAIQAGLVALLSLDFALRFLAGGYAGLDWWSVVALAVLGLASAAAWLIPWSRMPLHLVASLPLLDLVAIGLFRLNPAGSAAGILAVIPALWLAHQFGRRGAAVAALAALALVGAPPLILLGASAMNLSRSLLLPIVVGWAGLAFASSLTRLRASLAESEVRKSALFDTAQTLEVQRRFAAATLDTVDIGLVLLDARGAYLSMNRHHEVLMRLAFPGGHAGQAGQLGAVFAEDGVRVLTQDDMPTFRASQGEEFDDCRIWIGADPLTRRALSVSARSVRDGDRRFEGAALAYKDVTEFMRAMRIKDEFVASVSHELRTPLTSISGYVSILLESDDLPDEPLSHLQVVARNTDRLQRLVSDLLQTAQDGAGALEVFRSPADVSEIVSQSVEAAHPFAQSGGLELSLLAPPYLRLLVDPQRFAQVVDNLVSNAIKYTPAGGRVEVKLAVDGDRAELSVSDTGVGIGAADRERLFTRFFRARSAEGQSVQGVGLGLSIAKKIVESHGGRIEVESQLGVGSVFRVRLPMDVDEHDRTQLA